MSEMSSRPWLEKMFASKSLELNQKREKVGRLVQLIRIEETEDKKYPVICEISDKKNYMRAALSRKLVKKLEKLTNKSVVALQGANAVVIEFIPKLYTPPKKHADESRDKVPKHVRDDTNAQFWMLITNVGYMGGDGNGTFDEPVFINTSPHVTKRIEAYLSLIGESTKASAVQESSTHVDQIDPDVSMAGSDADNNTGVGSSDIDHARKRQRVAESCTQVPSTQAQCVPVLSQVPFLTDIDAAWQSEALWESLAVQQACVPLMPMCSLEAGGHVRPTDDPREASVGGRVSAAHERQEPGLAASRGVRQQGHGSDPQPPRAEYAAPSVSELWAANITPEIPSLGRLLEPEGHSCVESAVMMEHFYGPEESSPLMRDIDSPLVSLLKGSAHGLFDSVSGHWDQSDPFAIRSQPENEVD
ncbi:hypothetical protein FB645_002611 [Coemansia sp. IMI 203386]|nr:hypothetical protein FB645_002611 [Coemansia sp. IMI 203386]